MGMFDEVIVDVAIPGIPHPKEPRWQTKEFDAPALDVYKITADGRLLREVTVWDNEQEYCRPTGEWETVPHHGDLWMCSFADGYPGTLHWIVARFTEGRLVSMRSEAAVHSEDR